MNNEAKSKLLGVLTTISKRQHHYHNYGTSCIAVAMVATHMAALADPFKFGCRIDLDEL